MRARRETISKFVKVRCPKCKNEQMLFGNATTTVECLVCNRQLSKPAGGKASIKARVLEVI